MPAPLPLGNAALSLLTRTQVKGEPPVSAAHIRRSKPTSNPAHCTEGKMVVDARGRDAGDRGIIALVGRSIDRMGRVALIGMGLWLVACSDSADLPAGWEDAERIIGLAQSTCEKSATEAHEERATLTPGARRLAVEYFDALFRCEQKVEGFYKDVDGRLDLLVQPIDLHPSSVARCGCLYDIAFAVEGLSAGDRTVTLFRRGDEVKDPSEPVTISSQSVVIE